MSTAVNQRDQVESFVEGNPGLAARDIAEAIEANRSSIRKTLSRLVAEERLCRIGTRYYRPVEWRLHAPVRLSRWSKVTLVISRKRWWIAAGVLAAMIGYSAGRWFY